MKTLAIASCLFLIGCITEPKIETTSSWEGHYYSFDELKNKIEG